MITGILLARTVAGVVADLAGWRAVYLSSAVVTATLAVLLRLALPADRPPTVTMPYRRLLVSTVLLFARHPLLRVRGMLALLVFAAFSTLWSSVVQPLSSPPWSLTHTAIGAFGLARSGRSRGRGSRRPMERPRSRTADHGYRAGPARRVVAPPGLHPAVALGPGDRSGPPGLRRPGRARHQPVPHLRRPPGCGKQNHRRLHDLLSAGSALGAIGSSTAYAAVGWTGVSALGTAFSCSALLLWATTRRLGSVG